MMRHHFVLLLSIVTLPAISAGQVSYMDIHNGVVIFATDEGKAAASPECADESTADKWALSLQSDNGRAMYSLLMTAMASDMAIGVESAADCADADGLERPQRLWFDSSAVITEETAVETVTTYKTVAYGWDSNTSSTSAGVSATLTSPAGNKYMNVKTYSSGSKIIQCVDSQIVTISDADKKETYACVIEVETPLVNSSSN